MSILLVSNRVQLKRFIQKGIMCYSTELQEKIQRIAKNDPLKAQKLETKYDFLKDYTCIYRFKGVRHICVLSRLKVYQTLLTLSLGVSSFPLYAYGLVNFKAIIYLNIASVIALGTLYIISRLLINIICAMYISKDGDKILISHLNFWARRRNMEIAVNDLEPLVYSMEDLNNLILKLSLRNMSGQMYYSLRLAEFYDRKEFYKLLKMDR